MRQEQTASQWLLMARCWQQPKSLVGPAPAGSRQPSPPSVPPRHSYVEVDSRSQAALVVAVDPAAKRRGRNRLFEPGAGGCPCP